MNGTAKYLIDTNFLIYYLNGEMTAIQFINRYRGTLCISIINKLEVLSYPYTEDEDVIIRNFLNGFDLLLVDDNVLEQTILLRRQRRIKLPDAIIAATALYHNLILVTRNTSDFKDTGIVLCNPFEEKEDVER